MGKQMSRSDEDENQINHIEGKNPVLEALKAGITIDKILITDKHTDKAHERIADMARSLGIPFIFTDKRRLDDISATGRHQGVIAYASLADYSDIEDILECARQRDEKPFIFMPDGIEDPHNLGALIRTAHECGAHGLIISKRHSCGITPVVARAAAGATNHIHIARVSNISQTIDKLKSEGLWFACADMDGELMYKQDFKCPLCLVIGNEGKGVSSLVKSKCDFITSIPMYGRVGSLNASVAAAVLAYEVVRQRRFV